MLRGQQRRPRLRSRLPLIEATAQYVDIKGPIREKVDPTTIKLILAAIDDYLATRPYLTTLPERVPATSEACRVPMFTSGNFTVTISRDGRASVHDVDAICPATAKHALAFLADRASALAGTDRWIPRRW